jgi:ketoreductase RED2
MSEFADRVVVVTGSSSGIGEAIARRFGALGATVIVNSSSSVEAGERVAAEIGNGAWYQRADISDREQARDLIDAVIERFGRVDVLVNNAGWTTRVDHGDLDGMTDEIFEKTFDVNVFGTWWLTKAAIPHLRAVEDGNVVTITSIAGLRPVGSSMAYSMAKAALNQMTLLLAKSYGPVRFNAVAPGLVATPWTSDWGDQHAAIAARNPVPRSATPLLCCR